MGANGEYLHLSCDVAYTRSMSRHPSARLLAHHTSLAFASLRVCPPLGKHLVNESLCNHPLYGLHLRVALRVSASASSIASRSPSSASTIACRCWPRLAHGSANAMVISHRNLRLNTTIVDRKRSLIASEERRNLRSLGQNGYG